MRARVKHEVRVLDTGDLEARCLVGGEACWSGSAWRQSELGVGGAMDRARAELAEHVAETGHTEVKR